MPPLPVPQATTWELIGVSGNKPSARTWHVAAWSDAANGLYLHGGLDGSSGLRRSGGAGTGIPKAFLTTSGSSAARLALGMERKHGVVVRFFLGRVKTMRSWAFLDVSVE